MTQTEGTEESNSTNAPRGALNEDERSYFHIITVCGATELKQQHSSWALFQFFLFGFLKSGEGRGKQSCFMTNSCGAVQKHEILRQHNDSTASTDDTDCSSQIPEFSATACAPDFTLACCYNLISKSHSSFSASIFMSCCVKSSLMSHWARSDQTALAF